MINLDNVLYKIENTKILNDITLSIERGEKIAIIGCNGCGKTTLVKLIDALIFPSSGDAKIFGLKSTPKNKHMIHRQIGFLFQNPSSSFVGNTVEEDICFTLDNFDIPKEKWNDIVKSVLKRVNLDGFRKREIKTLSGGEMQKVALASNLAINVSLLILDEATSSLDVKSKKEVVDEVLKNDINSQSLIAITHETEAIISFNKVIGMKDGQIIAFGLTRDILTNVDLLKELNVEPPFAVAVYQALKERGVLLPYIPLTEEELEALL